MSNPNFVTAEELYEAFKSAVVIDCHDWKNVSLDTRIGYSEAAKVANQKIAGIHAQLRVYDNVLEGFKRMLDGKIGKPAD